MIRLCMFAFGILEQGGGLEKYFIDTARGFYNNKEISIDIVTLDDKHTYFLVRLISLFYFKKYDSSRVKKDSSTTVSKNLDDVNYIKAKNFREAREILQRYNVIYSKNELIESFVLKYLIGFKKIPNVIFGCHTPIHYPIASSIQAKIHNILYGGFIYKRLANRVTSFHVLNTSDEKYLKHSFENKRIYKIQNPFDYKKFKSNKVQYSIDLGLSNDKINIVWVGRLVLQKGVKDLVEIIKDVNKKLDKRVSWTIVGSGSEDNQIQTLAQEFNNIQFIGQTDHVYIPSILAQHDILVSTSHWEGYPYNILEAHAAEIPVFAYNIPGCNDLIENNKNGILMSNLNEYKSKLKKYIMNTMPKLNASIDTNRTKDIYSSLLSMYKDNV